MLYLGRGKLAFLYLLAGIAMAVLFLVAIDGHIAPDLSGSVGILSQLPLSIVGAIHAWFIARRRTSEETPRWYARWYFLVALTLAPLALALAIRTLLFQPFDLPSTSMSPSLNVGDYFFVSKFAYYDADPKRGDIVVFHWGGGDYVKRIIGLPGDRVQMVNDRLVINGVIVPQHRIADFVEQCGNPAPCRVPQYVETLPGGRTDKILDRISDGALDNTPVFMVPKDRYFVLGDNRDNSDDSRGDLGYIPRTQILGRAAIKFAANRRLVWQPVE
jgi:signal peptidase I